MKFNRIPFILIFFQFQFIIAQNFEWQKAYGSKTREYCRTASICGEEKGGSAFLINVTSTVGIKSFTQDSICFGSFVFKLPTSLDYYDKCYLVRLDSNGKVTKAKFAGNFNGIHMCRDSDGNFYINGNTRSDTIATVDSIKYHDSPAVYFYAKYDKDFNLKWSFQIDQSLYNFWNIYDLVISEGHLYFTGIAMGKFKIGTANYNFGSAYKLILGEINLANGNILWSNYLNINSSNYAMTISGLLRLKNKLYLSGFINGSGGTVLINSDTLFVSGSFVIETDTLGNYLKRFAFDNNYQSAFKCISTDGKHLYLGGFFRDTCQFGSQKIIPELTFGGGSNINTKELFITSLTTSFIPRWFYHPKILNKSNSSYFQNEIIKAVCSDGFIYFGGTVGSKILIDSNTISPGWYSDVFICKTDTLSNVLWATSGKTNAGSVESMDAIGGKSVFAVGNFLAKLELGKFSDTGIGGLNGWVTKITDYAIKRGFVIPGPYCAGDTFKIPYNLIGKYDSNNYLIAQLSNEEGNFDVGYRELGRLKSNQDGTITGILPLFQVASSPKYRIRILSTQPAVQSYYKTDTLRLLIYSRDKAYAGKDTIICRGDTIPILTYGGTKWKWTPNFHIKDSISRVALVWPNITTKYRITIADSSGCGAADTAYKTIIVRKSPKAIILTPDTSICIGSSIPIIASFKYGDSLNYSWQWYSKDINGQFTEIRTGSLKQQDTLVFKMPNNEKDSQQIILFLKDGCSDLISSTSYTIRISKQKAKVTLMAKDTALCPGTKANIIASFKNGYAPGYSWQWYETNNSGFWFPGIIGSKKTTDTLFYAFPLNALKNKKVRVILKDNCSEFRDTSEIQIFIRDTLQTLLNTGDTALCKGSHYTWKAKGLGGVPNAYQFTWTNILNGQVLSTTDSFSYTADSTMQVKVTLTDHCMPNNSSTLLTINVHPELSGLIFNGNNPLTDTTVCNGKTFQLHNKSKGGIGSNYSYEWRINNVSISNKDSILFNTAVYFPKNGGTQSLTTILKDQCSLPDTARIQLIVLPALSVTGSTKDSICFNYKVLFKAKTIGGKGIYQYRWLDENNILQGNDDSLMVNYTNASQIGIVKRLFIAGDGCSVPDDSVELTSYFRPPLSFQLTASDSCPTTSSILNMNPKGGKGNYSINWYQNNVFIGASAGLKTVIPTSAAALFKAVIKDGCSNNADSAIIQLALKPVLQLSIKGLCLGDLTIATVRDSSWAIGNQYHWELDNNTVPGTDSFITISFPLARPHQIRVSSDNTKLCIGRDTANISILEKPIANFNYERLKDFNSGYSYHFTDQSSKATAWNWNFGNSGFSNTQNPDFNFKDTGYKRVQLIVSNQQMCFDTAEKIIPVLARIQFFFPTAFSPNGNGINDDFGLNPNQYYLVKTYHLEIFNRWGEKVFQTEDMREHWLSADKLVSTSLNERKPQQGVYLFKAIITDILDERQEITGAVEVLR